MTKIPPAVLKDILSDPFYKTCAKYGQHGHECKGKITFDHTIIFGGKQLQKKFAIIPLCSYGHSVNEHQDGGDLDKEMNLWIALNRATNAEIQAISKAINYTREKERLNTLYGPYEAKLPKQALLVPADMYQTPKGGIKKGYGVTPKVRQFWYPVKESEKLMIEKCQKHFKENEGLYFTPFQMIERMIVEFSQQIDQLQEEHRM